MDCLTCYKRFATIDALRIHSELYAVCNLSFFAAVHANFIESRAQHLIQELSKCLQHINVETEKDHAIDIEGNDEVLDYSDNNQDNSHDEEDEDDNYADTADSTFQCPKLCQQNGETLDFKDWKALERHFTIRIVPYSFIARRT